MTEDDIRTKVVYPWLAGSGFDATDISIEFSFEIRLGRSAYRNGGKPQTPPAATQLCSVTTVRPPTDVLVRRGQQNLMVVGTTRRLLNFLWLASGVGKVTCGGWTTQIQFQKNIWSIRV